jgi:hypothetical protein
MWVFTFTHTYVFMARGPFYFLYCHLRTIDRFYGVILSCLSYGGQALFSTDITAPLAAKERSHTSRCLNSLFQQPYRILYIDRFVLV